MKRRILKQFTALMLSTMMTLQFIPNVEVKASEVVLNGDGFGLSIVESASEGQKKVTLDWDKVDFNTNYSANTKYFVVRKNLTSGKWELRGNYSKEKIRVLNLYPNSTLSMGLKTWMENLNAENPNVNIEVTQVDMDSFNKSYSNYLYKDSEGFYNYDVVVFGFQDSNNYRDLNSNSANYIREFIEYGGGVLFGHDTVNVKPTSGTRYFNDLLDDYMDIVYMPTKYDGNKDGVANDRETWVYSDKISVSRQTSATTYPFDINGLSLKIPLSHTLGQLTKDPKDIILQFEKNYYDSDGSGPYFSYKSANKSTYVPKDTEMIYYKGDSKFEAGWYPSDAYLLVNNNVGYIQCGHTSGSTNLAEQKVLANLMYAMSVMFFDDKGVDQTLDVVPPTMPTFTKKGNILNFDTTDEGAEYVYRIIAMPIGYNIVQNMSGMMTALNDYSATSYDDYKIQFSKPIYTDVPGSYKTYYYTVDNKATADIVYDSDNANMKTLAIGDTLDVSTLGTITPSTYLHIVASDKANNRSEIRNINLYDLYKITESTVNFVDENGATIAPSVTNYNEVINSTFTPAKPIIDGYEYYSSSPSQSITLSTDTNNNVITHIYKKINNKKVIAVEHRKYPTVVTNTLQIAIVSGVSGSTKSFDIPTSTRLERASYYTVGSIDGTQIPITDTKLAVGFNDEEPIFIHYDAIEREATLNIVDSLSGDLIGTVSKKGHVGDTITFNKNDVLSMNISNIDCYSDSSKINSATVTINLVTDATKNVKDVVFTPRVKDIVYRGYDFTSDTATQTVTTSGAGIKSIRDYVPEILGQTRMTYSTINKSRYEDIEMKNFDGWTRLETSKQVDYSNTTSTVYVNYYKGVRPDQRYSYVVNKYDILSKELINTYSSGDKNVLESADIDISPIEGHYSSAASREVDYKAKSVKVTDPKGVVTVYSADSDIDSLLPKLDSDENPIIGDYIVEVEYAPIVNAIYNEVVYDKDGKTTTNTYDFEVEYNGNVPYQYESTQSLKYYRVDKALVDGVEVSNFDFKIAADKYDKTVEVEYRPYVYTISSKALLKNGSIVTTINNIVTNSIRAFIEETTLRTPVYNDYAYYGYEVVGGTNSDYEILENKLTEEDGAIITFDALKEGDYSVNVIYKEKATMLEKYVDTKGNELAPPITSTSFVGDELTVALPVSILEDYKLSKIVFDGIELAPTEFSERFAFEFDGENVKFTVGKYTATFVYVFEERVEEIVDESNNDNDDSSDEIVTTIDNGKDPVVKEPTIKEPTTKDPIVVPERKMPTLKELEGLTEGEINRLFNPYIQGYPDGEVKPQDPVKRSEFMTIIYNLFAEGAKQDSSVLDRFADIDESEWYNEAIAYCVDNKIIGGYTDGTVRPNDDITRAELAAIIAKFYKDDTVYENHFVDLGDGWATNSINKLYALGIVGGYGDGTFKPNQTATRAEVVSLVNRLVGRPVGYKETRDYPDLTPDFWAYEEMMNASNGNNLPTE